MTITGTKGCSGSALAFEPQTLMMIQAKQVQDSSNTTLLCLHVTVVFVSITI